MKKNQKSAMAWARDVAADPAHQEEVEALMTEMNLELRTLVKIAAALGAKVKITLELMRKSKTSGRRVPPRGRRFARKPPSPVRYRAALRPEAASVDCRKNPVGFQGVSRDRNAVRRSRTRLSVSA